MSKVVCVTGASGAIGSWLVRLLLERGYTVHATVQDLKNEDETKHLEAMEGAKSRLCLFQMDLLDYDSIAAAIKGCAGVFHLACPIIIGQVKDPEKETLEPAIKGTVNVLKAAKEAGVERVVVTSSTSAIIPSPNWPADKVKGENCWTDLDYCREKGGRVVPNLRIRMWYMPKLELQAIILPQARVVPGPPGKDESMNHFTITNTSHVYLLHKLQLYYPIAKTLAEKASWDFAKETGFDVVMINPGTALGPLIPPRINASMAVLVSVLKGDTETYKDFFMGMAHFKDVATAHILAFEKKKAAGRHLCVEAIRHYGDYVAKVAELYPEYNVAKLPKDTQPGLLRAKNVSKKLIDLGLEFTSIDQIIKDAVESLKNKGYV